MSWAIKYDGTDEYFKVSVWSRSSRKMRAVVYETRKEALARIDSMYYLKKAGFSFVPIEVDLPVEDKFNFHHFKRGKKRG